MYFYIKILILYVVSWVLRSVWQNLFLVYFIAFIRKKIILFLMFLYLFYQCGTWQYTNESRRGKWYFGALADSDGLITLRIRAVWLGLRCPLAEFLGTMEYNDALQSLWSNYRGLDVRKHTLWHVRPTKTQISLHYLLDETLHSLLSKMRPVKWRVWSDWANAQANLNLHMSEGMFSDVADYIDRLAVELSVLIEYDMGRLR